MILKGFALTLLQTRRQATNIATNIAKGYNIHKVNPKIEHHTNSTKTLMIERTIVISFANFLLQLFKACPESLPSKIIIKHL
jgi:hypothetical protein